MKKYLVLTAIAATLAAPAFAQSSVTIYGRLNLSVESTKLNGEDRDWVEKDNSSRIGFMGEEDLGGGNKAIFKMESGFSADTGAASGGTSRFWGRESTVGLSTKYGTVKLGNLGYGNDEAYHAIADYVSWFNHDTGITADALYGGPNYYNGTGLENSISYNTPVIEGFQGWVQTAEAYSAGDYSTNGTKPIAVAAYYDRGPLHLGASFDKMGSTKSYAGRINYDLGAFGVGGYVEHVKGTKDGFNGLYGLDSREYTTWRLVGMYTLGNNEFHLNYGGTTKVKSENDAEFDKAWQFTAGYNYNLSKRTKVYAFYTKLKDDDAMFSTAYNGKGGWSTYGVGLRHNF
jgi:predicted porin